MWILNPDAQVEDTQFIQSSDNIFARQFYLQGFELNIDQLPSHRIVQNFRVSKFSRIAIFVDFIEIISRIRCTHTLHARVKNFH